MCVCVPISRVKENFQKKYYLKTNWAIRSFYKIFPMDTFIMQHIYTAHLANQLKLDHKLHTTFPHLNSI